MTIPEQLRSLTKTKETFPDGTWEDAVFQYIFSRFDQLGTAFDSVTIGGVAVALGWVSDREKRKAISQALNFLSCQSPPLFERRYELWLAEDDSVLGSPIPLDHKAVRNALENHVLINPLTGESVENYEDLIKVFYAVTPEAKEIVAKGLSKS